MNPVALPPGRAKLSIRPAPTGSPATGNTIGTVRVSCSSGATDKALPARMMSGVRATSSAACLRMSAALGPAQWRQRLQECPEARLSFLIVGGCGQKDTDAPRPLALLRARCEGRRRSRAAEHCDEAAPVHGWPCFQRETKGGGGRDPLRKLSHRAPEKHVGALLSAVLTQRQMREKCRTRCWQQAARAAAARGGGTAWRWRSA